jgi:hypothetical protein
MTPNDIIETGVLGALVLSAEALGIAGVMLIKGKWRLSTAPVPKQPQQAAPDVPAAATEVFATIPETAEPTSLQRAS